jgi:hypothetical protein
MEKDADARTLCSVRDTVPDYHLTEQSWGSGGSGEVWAAAQIVIKE